MSTIRFILLAPFVIGAALLGWGFSRMRSRTRREEAARRRIAEEGLEEHACETGAFLVTSRLHAAAHLPGDLYVFQGLFCSSCERELVCVKCWKVPEIGALLTSAQASEAHWCCDDPHLFTRKSAQPPSRKVIPFPGRLPN